LTGKCPARPAVEAGSRGTMRNDIPFPGSFINPSFFRPSRKNTGSLRSDAPASRSWTPVFSPHSETPLKEQNSARIR
jgi:hypothetical protein